MSDLQTAAPTWQPASTAPTDKTEFWSLALGVIAPSGDAAPETMLAWHPKTTGDDTPPEPPYPGLTFP